MALTGVIARTWLRVPWVLEIRDIWPESIVTVGAMKKGLSVRALKWLERSAYRSADNIVAVTDSFLPHIAKRCGNPAKINVIKNGVDLTFFTRDGNPIAAKRALGFEDHFVAAYVGTHGMAHGLNTILEAARLTVDDPRILYVMVGDGAERERLIEKARAMKLNNVRILGQRPKSDMPLVWAATDASLILLRRNELFKKVLPSKMFEAMGMARPIVLGVEGEAKELLHAAGAGIAITPESAEELAAAVRRLAAEPLFQQHTARAEPSMPARNSTAQNSQPDTSTFCLQLPLTGRGDSKPRRVEARRLIIHRTISNASRAIAFGRQIPMRKIVHRVELDLRRRLRDHLPQKAPASTGPQPLSASAPQPLFPPRGGLRSKPTARSLSDLVGRELRMPRNRVDWNAPGPGSAHQLLRMTLHYMEYLEGADDKLFSDIVDQWIRMNPANQRGAWRDSWNSYALSLRVVVWMQQLAMRRDRLDQALLRRIHASLTEQLCFLEQNLETDLGGNHLIKNIKALIWALGVFRWRRSQPLASARARSLRERNRASDPRRRSAL